MRPEVLKSWTLEVDYSRAPCLGADQDTWALGTRLDSGYPVHCAVSDCIYGMLWRMPEMVAPRALVFRPLVKGNEALGTRLGT